MIAAARTLSQFRFWLTGIGSGLALLLFSGCPQTPVTSTPTAPAVAEAEFVRPLLKDWEKPTVALMLSGEMFGYMEPCGCSLTQSGGLERRGHLQQKLQEKGWDVVPLDAGGLLKRTRTQDQIKFETILLGLKQLGYTSVAAGESELRLPPDYLISQFAEGDGIPLGGLLTGCNVILFDSPELGVPKPWRIVESGGVKIGVTAVLGKTSGENVSPEGVQTQIRVRPAAEALREVLPLMEAEQPTLRILLSHGTLEEAEALAKEFPQFQAILTAGGPEDPADEPTKVGDTLILQTGHKGKYVGILGYYPKEQTVFRWELVNLDNVRFTGDKRMHELMRTYQQQLQDQELAKSSALLIPHPSGHSYVGAAQCGECHTKAYAKWKGTKHGHALESLARGRKGQEENWVSRIYDPECLCCHVTGWDPQNVLRYDSGYLDEATSTHLAAQQCENCHGPGSHHTELEWSFRKDMKSVDRELLNAARRNVKRNFKSAEQEICSKCHDHENSPKFNFEKYWKEVVHPWKD